MYQQLPKRYESRQLFIFHTPQMIGADPKWEDLRQGLKSGVIKLPILVGIKQWKCIPYHPWDERYIYLYMNGGFFMINVGEYIIHGYTWIIWVW